MKVNVPFFLLKVLIILQYLNIVADLFPSYIQIGVLFLWILSMLGSQRELLNKCIYLSGFSLIIFLIVLLRCFISGSIDLSYFSPMAAAISRYQVFAYLTLFPYVISLDRKKKQQIFNLTLICIAITILVSLYYIKMVDPQAIRNTQGVSYFGVGDFLLMYGMAMLMGPLFVFILEKIKRHDRPFMYIVSFILMSICLILCNLVTSVVISVVSIAVTLFISRGRKSWQLLLGIVLAIAIAMKSFWAQLLENIARSGVFYWSTSNKLIAIANVLRGDFANTDTLSLRLKLTMISVNSFKDNPVFGIDFANHKSGVIGGHAQWADDLARYGILGNCFIVISYMFAARYTIRYSEGLMMKYFMISEWIVFILLGFLNPCLSGTILMVMFVVVPAMNFYFEEESSTYENRNYKSIQ